MELRNIPKQTREELARLADDLHRTVLVSSPDILQLTMPRLGEDFDTYPPQDDEEEL